MYDQDMYALFLLDCFDLFNYIDENEQLIDLIVGRQGCYLVVVEWRLLGWFECQGLDYDFYSEIQFYFNLVLLDEYCVFIISTYLEYWLVDMYY